MARTMTKGPRRGRKPTKAKGADAPAKPNKRERPVVIREAIRVFQQIEKERDDLNARAKATTNMLIKGELGMTKKNFFASYGELLLEADERTELFATKKEIFQAMKQGDKVQIDFLEAMESADRDVIAARPVVVNVDPVMAESDGYEAAIAAKSMSDNPFDAKKQPKIYAAWDLGHHRGLVKRLEGMPSASETAPGTMAEVGRASKMN